MSSAIELINKRCSIRSYSDKGVEEEKKKYIQDLLVSNNKGPFGNSIRFQLLDLDELDRLEIKQLGTYGIIKGAKLFIAGAVKDSPKCFEDYGYCLEKVILELTGMGFGTCWLGGTFNKAGFAKIMKLSGTEIIPAIIPVGYAADKRSLMESLMKMASGSKKRKPWEDLFFYKDFSLSLKKEKADRYAVPLESVRLAPSAVNRQPWRIIKQKDKNVFNFYISKKSGSGKDYKNIDIGIAMCHFELSATELGLKGSWKEIAQCDDRDNIEYIVSWMEK